MEKITLFIILSISFILPASYVFADEQANSRVNDLINKSKSTRKAVEKDTNTKRDPASLKSNYMEFENLMNDQKEQDWLEEVDKLSVE